MNLITTTTFGLTWYGGVGAQAYLLNKKKEGEMVIHRHKAKKCREWALTTEDKLLKLIKKNREIYEIITDQKRKVYFDIDAKYSVYKEVMAILREKIPDGEFNVSGYENDEKCSYHIIVNNYHLDNVDDCKGLKEFCKHYSGLGFDSGVYGKNRPMKCINQAKPDKPIQAMISGSEKLEDHLITCFFKDNSKNARSIFQDYEEFSQEPVNINRIPQKYKAYTEEIPISEQKADDLIYLFNPNNEHTVSYIVALYLRKLGKTFDDFWEWRKRKVVFKEEDENEIRNKWLKEWNEEVEKKELSGNNYADRNLIIKYLRREYRNLEDTYYERLFMSRSEYVLDKDIKKQFADKYIFTNNKIDYIALPMGSNKTGALISYIEHKFDHTIFNHDQLEDKIPIDSFIVLSCRKSLASNMKGRMGKDVVDYNDVKQLEEVINLHNLGCTNKSVGKKKSLAIPEVKKLITTPYSLHYSKGVNYDLVIIDEVEMFHNSWTSDQTHEIINGEGKRVNNYGENWRTFVELVKNCKKIILLDALYSSITDKVLFKSILPNEKINIIGSSFKYPTKDLIIYEDTYQFISILVEKLKENKKIYFFWPYSQTKSKKKHNQTEVVNFIEEKVGRKLKTLIYSSISDTDVKKTLEDVNKHWLDLDLVVVNQAVTIGVNFDIPNVFDSVFIADAKFVSQREIVQTSCRIRHTISNKIHYTYIGGRSSLVEKNMAFRYEIPDAYIKDITYEKMSKSLKIVKYLFDKANIVQTETVYKKNKDFKKDFEEIVKDDKYSWDNIPDIDDMDAYIRIINSGASCIEDTLKIMKYKFREALAPHTNPLLLKSAWEFRKTFVNLYNMDKKLLEIYKHCGDELDKSKKFLTSEERKYLTSYYRFRHLNIDKKTDSEILQKAYNKELGFDYYVWDKNNKKYVMTDMGISFKNIQEQINDPDIFIEEEEEEDIIENFKEIELA